MEDYRGIHQAPRKGGDTSAPMYDVTQLYPDDFYSTNAARYYGDSSPRDQYVVNLIHAVRNKPNAKVKIYRAVPDFNHEISKKIQELSAIRSYRDKYGFFPMKNQIVNQFRDKYEGLPYDEAQESILRDIDQTIALLEKKKVRLMAINDGDWVTIDKQYAVQHGESALNGKYKILSKTVLAKNLYTDANSIYEWGYNE
jgi:hypothetical protein